MSELVAAGERGRGPVDLAAGSKSLGQRLEVHRGELTAHCSRMLGSAFEAEDAVQETLLRAWCAFDRFEGRASLRTWLYRIATNVCRDMRGAKQRRAMPIDATAGQAAGSSVPVAQPDATWIRPLSGGHISSTDVDPAEQAVARDRIRLAFVVALLDLPARQRSILILRDVLRWKATEVAELLGTTVASVESALQRARSNLAGSNRTADQSNPVDDDQRLLAQRYVDCLERHDIDSLVSLLRGACVLPAVARSSRPPAGSSIEEVDTSRVDLRAVRTRDGKPIPHERWPAHGCSV
jgi:RNA polymerase sigma-70 factor, ECF subfamily